MYCRTVMESGHVTWHDIEHTTLHIVPGMMVGASRDTGGLPLTMGTNPLWVILECTGVLVFCEEYVGVRTKSLGFISFPELCQGVTIGNPLILLVKNGKKVCAM